MKWTIENKVRLGFGCALVFLFLASAAACWNALRSMDTFRAAIERMETPEQGVLAMRMDAAHAAYRSTLVVLALSGALALLAAGAAGYVAARDMARRRDAEEERDRLFLLSRDLMCLAGFDGRFKHLNPAWEDVLGISRRDLLSTPFLEFVHPNDRAGTADAAARLARGEEVIRFENRYRTGDGSYRWLSWNARADVGRGLIYATARDVTEQKRAHEQIAALNADLAQRASQLEEANAELEAFSYSVSHDLRAPLRHIDGFVSNLRKNSGAALEEKGRRYLDIISDSARQMGSLIDDLLVFSRMGRAQLRKRKVDLETLTREVITSLESHNPQRHITWINGNLPEVLGDPAMLRQAMINLLSNAVKYTRPRQAARIEIGYSESAAEFIVFVRDNGVGFEMEYAHKLFGVFQRLHRADEFEGTGIGLANVRRIVHRHGGRTWAEGKPDDGATFYFSLPKQQKGTA